jgi:hypothetical protein
MWQATLDVGADGDGSSSTHLHVPDLSSAEELLSADVLSWLGWDTGFGPPGQALYCVDCRGFGESWPEGPVAALTSGVDGVASSGFTADGRHPRWASYGLDYMYGHDCSHYHSSTISRDACFRAVIHDAPDVGAGTMGIACCSESRTSGAESLTCSG